MPWNVWKPTEVDQALDMVRGENRTQVLADLPVGGVPLPRGAEGR